MAGPRELPFEYEPRQPDLYKRLIPEPDPEQQKAIDLLEERDRALENYLKTAVGGAGGTAQSLIAVYQNQDTFGGTGTFLRPLAFPIPSDVTFTYYVKWEVEVRVFANLLAGERLSCSGWGSMSWGTPGTGFEQKFGYGNSIEAPTNWTAAGFDDVGRPQVSGFASRIEGVPGPSVGTTVTLTHTINVPYGGAIGYSNRAMVFSIPAGSDPSVL